MFLVSFFSWWYGVGWKQVLDGFARRSQSIIDLFSVHQLLRTLFAPWRRIITYPGAGLSNRLRAWGDNIFSRVVGFVVRVFVLFTAVVVLLAAVIFTLLELLAWPLLPLAVPSFIAIGLIT